MVTSLQLVGLPHSEISGSQVVCTYPKLIAAYHVLHRLPEPRHPPFALSFFFYDVKLLSTINGRSQNLYIVNLIVFARLIRNTYKSISIFCFYIRQYVKDRFPQLNEESESAVPIKVLHLLLSTISEYRTGCVPYQYTRHHL